MNILIKPIITEKATADVENFNRYTFVVSSNYKCPPRQKNSSYENGYSNW